MRVLILCAGEGSRWNNNKNVTKHMVVIEGEVLVERTVRQFLKYTDDIVIVSDGGLPDIPGTSSYIAKKSKKHKDMDKFLSSHEQWSDDRTIIVYGDVYFTDEAVEIIATNHRKWCFFLRDKKSEITGKPWGEIFAFSFDGYFNKVMLQTLKNIIFRSVVQDTPLPAGWTLLRYLLGVKKTRDIFVPEHRFAYININDWTEDFDYPHDLNTWLELRSKYLLTSPHK
jgi:hypothetical protein